MVQGGVGRSSRAEEKKRDHGFGDEAMRASKLRRKKLALAFLEREEKEGVMAHKTRKDEQGSA